MTFDELLGCVEAEGETFLKPQARAAFKKMLDPYFEEVRAFKAKLDPAIDRLKQEIAAFDETGERSEFLDMDNSPGEDYIACSNTHPSLDAPNIDFYYPHAEHGFVWGWMPKETYQEDPLKRLIAYAGWQKQEKQDVTMLQFASVAILHDGRNLGNGCNVIYFDSGDELADRAAEAFMKALRFDEGTVITPFGREQHKRVIRRLKNAFDTVTMKLPYTAADGDNAEPPGQHQEPFESTAQNAIILADFLREDSAVTDGARIGNLIYAPGGVVAVDGGTVNVTQHIQHITELRKAIAKEPKESKAFAKIAKEKATEILGGALGDFAKDKVKDAAVAVVELCMMLGPVAMKTAAFVFFKKLAGG